jgi:hypothetical protein
MRIRVNGQEDFIRVEEGLGELMDSTRTGAVPKTLMVRRLFRGHVIPVGFDYTNQDILGLVLMPGDEITVGVIVLFHGIRQEGRRSKVRLSVIMLSKNLRLSAPLRFFC